MKSNIFFWRILAFGVVVALMLPINSCTNLDENLYSSVPESNYFRNEAEVKTAVSQVYATLFNLQNHGSYFSTQEVNSNAVLYPQRGGDWEDGRQWLKTYEHKQDGTEDCFRNAWNFLFTGVANCNWAIHNIEQAAASGRLDASKAQSFIAEMRTVRALYYYWLLDTYGNVPIVDKYDLPAGFLPTNAPRAEVYAFLEKELTSVAGALPRSTVYGRFNYYAAQALLAHLYLNAAVYKGSAEWSKAAAAAKEAASGPYSLSASYRDVFKTNNEGSKENILVIPYDEVFAKGFNLPQMTLHYESQKTFNLEQQPWNGLCAAQEFYDLYDAADARRSNLIFGPQFASDGVTRLEDPQAEPSDPDGKPLTFTPQINELYPNCLRQAGARIGKFEFKLGATPNLSNDFPILRLGEVLLVQAEAEARAANDWSKALPIVNQIRQRAGLPTLSSLNADSFFDERAREVFYEGWHRSDKIRFGKFAQPTRLRPNTSDKKRELWPIPVTQLNANPNLKQNDGY